MTTAVSLKKRIRHIAADPRLARLMFKDTLSIVVYHDVSYHPSPFCQEHGLNVTPAQFEQQLTLLKEHFHIIGPDDLLRGHFPTPAAMVTFDDGMAGYFHRAVPIMEKMSIPSLLFLNMGPLQGKLFWSPLVTYLTAHDPQFVKMIQDQNGGQSRIPAFLMCDPKTVANYVATHGASDLESRVRAYYGEFGTVKDLEECAKNPFVFYGNHLYNHYNARHLTDEELRAEYRDNQALIDQFSCGRKLFAYPFGQPGSCFTPEQSKVLLSCGAEFVFYSGGGTNRVEGNKVVLDRVGVDPDIKNINDLISRLQAGSVRAAVRSFQGLS